MPVCSRHRPNTRPHITCRRPRARQRGARQSRGCRLHDRGPGVRRTPQPGNCGRSPRRKFAELLSRLGLRRWMRKLVLTLPKSYTERVFVVRTAIDMNVQRAAKPPSKTSCASSAATITRRRRRGSGRSRRRRARDGGRTRLRAPASSQPRRRCDAPARLLVQALRLRHRTDERLHAEVHCRRRSGLHRQLVPAELRTLLFRRGPR